MPYALRPEVATLAAESSRARTRIELSTVKDPVGAAGAVGETSDEETDIVLDVDEGEVCTTGVEVTEVTLLVGPPEACEEKTDGVLVTPTVLVPTDSVDVREGGV